MIKKSVIIAGIYFGGLLQGFMMKTEKLVSNDYAIYKLRRLDLVAQIQENNAEQALGLVVLFGAIEQEEIPFKQESSFYYLTGITEPGAAVVIDLEDGTTDLYIPNCLVERAKWLSGTEKFAPENAKALAIDEIEMLGEQCKGFQLYPFFSREEYANLLDHLEQIVEEGGSLYTLNPNTPNHYVEQRNILERVIRFAPSLSDSIVDISSTVADMRRTKDQHEIEFLYKAIEITALAQEAAAQAIADGMNEAEIQASIEYMFIGSGARPAFASIVGSGKNSTVLHYHDNNAVMKNGDLVVVDIGARVKGYCADITRTYPVSGTFTKRQKEIYTIVLETQEYIASIAKAGMWLSNREHPDQSLNHLAKKFIADKGYGNYFPHGIGHFLGLDTHDVGDYSEALREGDVITIEPGIYIPEERIGIRIEDNYWIVKDRAFCLSDYIPKSIEEIEAMVQEEASDDDEDEEDDMHYDS